jgi:PPE-repeat protein
MSLAKLDRRQMLMGIGAGAVGAGAAALAPATALAGDDDTSGLLGGWDITITGTSPPSPPREAVLMFAAGGGLVTVDSNPQTSGAGSWTKYGDNGFRFKFIVFDPTHGGIRVVVHGSGTAHQGTISGPFNFVVGNNLFSGSGTFSGTKIRP